MIKNIFGTSIAIHMVTTISLSHMNKVEFTRALPWREIALLKTFMYNF